ncbi:MAG: tetratricopeptide repeat protein [Burkholderiaceae bacterium]
MRELGRIEEALEAHRRALGLQPGSADVLSNIGVAEMERGAIEAAIAAFEQALSSQPHHPLAHRHLALCVNGRQRSEPLPPLSTHLPSCASTPLAYSINSTVTGNISGRRSCIAMVPGRVTPDPLADDRLSGCTACHRPTWQ